MGANVLLACVVFCAHGWQTQSLRLKERLAAARSRPGSCHDVLKAAVNPLQALTMFFLAFHPGVAFTAFNLPVRNPRLPVFYRCADRQLFVRMGDEELRIAEDGKPYPVQEYKDFYGVEWQHYWDVAAPYDPGPVSGAYGEPILGEQEALQQLLKLQGNLKMMENIHALSVVRDDVEDNGRIRLNYKYMTEYINLQTRPDRKARMEYQFAQQGMPATRFEAKTGENVKDSIIDRVWNTALNARFDPRQAPGSWHEIHDGERGCAGSHADLWLKCVARNCPMLILEDDALLGPLDANFSHTLQCVMKHMTENDPSFLHLQTTPAVWGDYKGQVTSTMQIRSVKYAWQTSGYIVWPRTAIKLLCHLPMHEPVDNFLSRLAYNDYIRMYTCDPPIIMQYSATDGDIPHTGVDDWSAVAPSKELDSEN